MPRDWCVPMPLARPIMFDRTYIFDQPAPPRRESSVLFAAAVATALATIVLAVATVVLAIEALSPSGEGCSPVMLVALDNAALSQRRASPFERRVLNAALDACRR